jgi:hypothetical protein
MNNTAENYELIKALEDQVIALKQKIRKEKEKKMPDTWRVIDKRSKHRNSHRYTPEHVTHRFYIYSENERRNVMQVYGDFSQGNRNSVYLSKFPQMFALITKIAEESRFNARTAKNFMLQAKDILSQIESDIKEHETYEI